MCIHALSSKSFHDISLIQGLIFSVFWVSNLVLRLSCVCFGAFFSLLLRWCAQDSDRFKYQRSVVLLCLYRVSKSSVYKREIDLISTLSVWRYTHYLLNLLMWEHWTSYYQLHCNGNCCIPLSVVLKQEIWVHNFDKTDVVVHDFVTPNCTPETPDRLAV